MICQQKYIRLWQAIHILKIVVCTRAFSIHSQEHFGYFVKDLFSLPPKCLGPVNNMDFWEFPKKVQNSNFLDIQMANLGLKVMTFFNSLGNVYFENDLIFNPSFNICWEKAKTVKTMTYMITSYMTWNLNFDVDIQLVLFTVLAFPQQIFG